MSPSWATTPSLSSTTSSRLTTALSPVTTSAAASLSSSPTFPLLLVLRGGGRGAASNRTPKNFPFKKGAPNKGKTGLAASAAESAATLDDDKSGNGSSSSFSIALSRWWFGHVPQPLRFFVSGNLGNMCFYACERFMYRVVFHSDHVILLFPDYEALLHSYKDSASFLLGYLLHIVAQHYLHARLVYGRDSIDTARKYWTTLFGMYQALLFAAFGSTFLNAALLHYNVMHRTAAFVTTLGVFACINYVWIGRIVSKAKSKSLSLSSTDTLEHDKKKEKNKNNKNNATMPIKNKKTTPTSSSFRGRSLRGGALQSSSSSCHSSIAPPVFQQQQQDPSLN